MWGCGQNNWKVKMVLLNLKCFIASNILIFNINILPMELVKMYIYIFASNISMLLFVQ